MRVQVRQCPFTGKIFEEHQLKKYVAHLAEVREGMKEKRKHNHLRKTFKEWLRKEKQKIVSIDMVVPWFLENQRTIMDAHNALGNVDWDGKFYKTDKFTELSMTATYNNHVSNSHQCPDIGVTNWCAYDTTKTTGYPGFSGYVKGKLVRAKQHDSEYPYSGALKLVGIKTGSGGGGNSSWEYDCKLFLADWPGLSQQLLVNKLMGVA